MTAVAALFALLRVAVAAHGHVGGLVVAGADFVSPTRYTHGVPIRLGTGYDGQFYYRMALNPLKWSRTAYGIHFDTLGRLDRVAYPALVWLTSVGQRAAVPVMMVVVNVAALGVLAGLCSSLARQAGRHPLWGLLLAGSFGFLWSLSRDLTELTEAVFVVAGLVAIRGGRPVVAGAVLSVAVLAREPALIIVAAIFVARAWALWGWRRHRPGAEHWRPGAADAAWLMPVMAFAAWQVALRLGTGAVLILTSGQNNSGLPFVGLADGFVHYAERLPSLASLLWFGELGVLAVVGALAAFSLSTSKAAVHERVAWVAAALLAVSLTRAVYLGDVGFRSLDDFFLLSGVLLLFSRVRLDLAGVLVAGAWCVVALQLVLFI
jgi:hypothetical protein